VTVGRIVISDGIPNLAPGQLFDMLVVRIELELEVCNFRHEPDYDRQSRYELNRL